MSNTKQKLERSVSLYRYYLSFLVFAGLMGSANYEENLWWFNVREIWQIPVLPYSNDVLECAMHGLRCTSCSMGWSWIALRTSRSAFRPVRWTWTRWGEPEPRCAKTGFQGCVWRMSFCVVASDIIEQCRRVRLKTSFIYVAARAAIQHMHASHSIPWCCAGLCLDTDTGPHSGPPGRRFGPVSW